MPVISSFTGAPLRLAVSFAAQNPTIGPATARRSCMAAIPAMAV